MKTTLKRSMAILLSIIMVFSVMAVGITSVSAATIDCETLYFQPSVWNTADARFAAYFYDLDGNSAWADATVRAADEETYKVSVPEGEWTNVIFARFNPAYTENDWNTSTVTDRVWNQTTDLEWDGINNCFTMSNWSAGAWSSYAVNEYCLVGLINGSNVGDTESDYNQVVNLITESESVTLTITEESYVYLKNAPCTAWYMTDGWLGYDVTSAVMYDTTTLPDESEANKLYVPAGIHKFTLEENADGTLTLAYEKIGEAPTEATTASTVATTASTAATTESQATEATEATVPTGSTATVISGTNMAKGKTVTVSCTKELSTTDANYSMTAVNKALAKLTNGTKNSIGAWFNNGQENVGFRNTVLEGPYSLTVDLGQGVAITGIQLYAYERTAWKHLITDKVTYSVSANGTDWVQIGEVEASETGYTYYNDPAYTDAGAHVYVRDFTLQCRAIKARYVKATFPTNTNGSGIVAFNEFEVYGTAATLPATATGTNLASGKTVTASATKQISTTDANYSMTAVNKALPQLVDGIKNNCDSYFNNGQPNVAFNKDVLTGPYSLTVDLGASSNINTIALYNYERPAWEDRLPADYVKYSVSADGSSWTTVGTVNYADAGFTHNADPKYTGTAADVYINDFTLNVEADNVRYVKATFTSNAGKYVIFNEFEVYGEEVQETTEATETPTETEAPTDAPTEAPTASSSASTTTYETYPDLRYYPACDSSYTTLYSAMVSVKVNPSLDNRTRIAAYNGIDYEATAAQNTELLTLLKDGKLLNPDFVPTYQLVGYIDGKDVGCNADADGIGLEFDDEMKVVNYFNEDSYVFVKTSDNVDWFMATDYSTEAITQLYNTSTGANEKMYVPAGKVEFVLSVEADGSLVLEYTVLEYPTEAPSYTIYDTVYYPACDSSYTGLIAALNSLNVDSSKEYRAVIAEFNGITDYAYTAEQNTALLNLLKAGELLNPEYVEPVKKYYSLVGNINGVDVGFDTDYESIGIEFDDEGNLTCTFTEDSYVFVKTTDNANWYMTDAYVTDTTATLSDTSTGSYEKMLAPAGVVTFKLVENEDGTLTLSYTVNQTEGNYTIYDTKYYPACDSSHVGLVAGLSSINVENSQAYRMKIALFNGMSDYAYTAEQNTTLLNLLKAGELLNPEYVEEDVTVIPEGSTLRFAVPDGVYNHSTWTAPVLAYGDTVDTTLASYTKITLTATDEHYYTNSTGSSTMIQAGAWQIYEAKLTAQQQEEINNSKYVVFAGDSTGSNRTYALFNIMSAAIDGYQEYAPTAASTAELNGFTFIITDVYTSASSKASFVGYWATDLITIRAAAVQAGWLHYIWDGVSIYYGTNAGWSTDKQTIQMVSTGERTKVDDIGEMTTAVTGRWEIYGITLNPVEAAALEQYSIIGFCKTGAVSTTTVNRTYATAAYNVLKAPVDVYGAYNKTATTFKALEENVFVPQAAISAPDSAYSYAGTWQTPEVYKQGQDDTVKIYFAAPKGKYNYHDWTSGVQLYYSATEGYYRNADRLDMTRTDYTYTVSDVGSLTRVKAGDWVLYELELTAEQMVELQNAKWLGFVKTGSTLRTRYAAARNILRASTTGFTQEYGSRFSFDAIDGYTFLIQGVATQDEDESVAYIGSWLSPDQVF